MNITDLLKFKCVLGLGALVLSPSSTMAQANPYRGLWVGEAKLSYVNEVSVPLNSNNVAIAPDPNVPTPTADKASLRLILHVNGAGQASLLKGVALLSRTGQTNLTQRNDSDIALVTDERLYTEFPVQPAARVASAAFDFGDSKATQILDAMVEAAAKAVTNSVANSTANLNTTAGRTSAENAARGVAEPIVTSIAFNANVAAAFNGFLQTNLNQAKVDAIAGAASPAATAASVLAAANALQAASPYGDSRAVKMVEAVLAAVAAGTNGAAKTNAAQNVAAAYAELDNGYQRFLAGKTFGDMIVAAATAAAGQGTNPTATAAMIRTAVESDGKVNDARQTALLTRVSQFRDGRATNAVEVVLSAIVGAAANLLTDPTRTHGQILSTAEAAGYLALARDVVRYTVPALIPSLDYTAFIQSSVFQASAAAAADAAAKAAVFEKKSNGLYTPDSLKAAAKQAAVVALRDAYASAARAAQTELPLVGTFAPGSGDPRLTWDIKQTNGIALGVAGLTGVIQLPASHPTNPFRHRRHPDHVIGFDILRNLRLDFDNLGTNALDRATYGVDRLRGTFREEIFGLHKPLGPSPKTQPIGLKVEGRFELNRISLIDTLNAR
jgi:hypothetical protein